MDLYFSPLACSMATRIAIYEAGGNARFIEVDTKAKRLTDGTDFLAINPLGYVPVIRTDNGELLTENSAILQHVAERFPDAALAPADGIERSRLQAWLSFIGTELHKGLFIPLLDRKAPEAAKQYAISKYGPRLDYLNTYLKGREFLLDRFSVADAYLTTVLNWSRATTIDFEQWPAVKDYFDRMRARPAIARAFAEEGALFVQEQARHKAA
ncbi:MAG: glutathione S-transferase N-terminal domain-containing protein [Xanthobacteraceae bacterium]|nr:glutathione S-transferase N-terminal domain-containing protein [Xanthobacteraceae bacterium]